VKVDGAQEYVTLFLNSKSCYCAL